VPGLFRMKSFAILFLLLGLVTSGLSACTGADEPSIGQAGQAGDIVPLVDQVGWLSGPRQFGMAFTAFPMTAEDRRTVLAAHSAGPLVGRGRILEIRSDLASGVEAGEALGGDAVDQVVLTFWNFAEAPVVVKLTADELASAYPGLNAAVISNGWASGMTRGQTVVEWRGTPRHFFWNVGFSVSFPAD
jgi:hypothetical protein